MNLIILCDKNTQKYLTKNLDFTEHNYGVLSYENELRTDFARRVSDFLPHIVVVFRGYRNRGADLIKEILKVREDFPDIRFVYIYGKITDEQDFLQTTTELIENSVFDISISEPYGQGFKKDFYTTVLLDVNGNTFKATGSVITNNGWYAVDALPDKRATLPPVSEGKSYSGRYELKQGFTEPPKPYTEADLITAMETAGKHLEDEEARALMKAENKGLGTPATRAGIINALFDNGYLTKNKKSVIPTEKGKFLIKHLPVEELKSPEMTGQWEKRLHDIADGKEDYQAFVSSMEQTVREWYSAVVSSANTEKYVSDEDTLSCPFCGARVIKGKFGYFCSAKKDTGCPFSVGKEYCGKAISDAQAIRLIEKGKTALIKGFKKKDGKGEFDAYLVVDKAAKKIKFEFPAKKK